MNENINTKTLMNKTIYNTKTTLVMLIMCVFCGFGGSSAGVTLHFSVFYRKSWS